MKANGGNDRFLIGAATAAHQVEGNNTHSDYWAMERMKNTSFVEPSGDACDHYNRYEEDIRLMAEAGLTAYRFSIEWARIEPEEGRFDEAEVAHYAAVIDCCLANGIEPIVTLHHFTSPKWLIEQGGWEAESTVTYFARYAGYIAEKLGDKIKYICTINEANMGLQIAAVTARYMRQLQAAAVQGAEQKSAASEGEGNVQVGLNLAGMAERMAAQKQENVEIFGTDSPQTFVSGRTPEGDILVMRAHNAARDAIKEVHPEIQVGLTLSLHDIQSIPGGEGAATKEWDEEFTHYLPYIKDDDFFGLQNYTRSVYGADGIQPNSEGARLTQMDYEIYPEALPAVIRRVHSELDIPIIVTENGIATSDDAERVSFIREAISGIEACRNEGIPILGYMYWSLLDNFEWQKGFSMTFGLIAVDRTTQARTPKQSLSVLGSYSGRYPARRVVKWNGGWTYEKEGRREDVTLPHTWNAIDGQDGGNDYYRGVCTYEKSFAKPALSEGERLWIEFRGVGMSADVYLNGSLLGRHEGGYSTFRFDLTDGLLEENILRVDVDNGANDRVYPQRADFTFYGGIYRDVYLVTVPDTHFTLGHFGGQGVKITPELSEDMMHATVKAEAWVSAGKEHIAAIKDDTSGKSSGATQSAAAGVTVTFTIADKTLTATSDENGYTSAIFEIDSPRLWNGKADPYLYTARASLESGDSVETAFGIRSISFDAERGFYLNGKNIRLCGTARHQDRQGIGNALSRFEHEEDIRLLIEMGANSVRLAHYQHDQYFYELCDRSGLIAWAEIPYISEHLPNGRDNTISQMTELVTQCYHHPSIICWGLSNEITAAGSSDESLMENHRALNDLCHRLDPTRVTTMAHVFMLSKDDPLVMLPDIRSYNLYYGWYVGDLEQNDEWFDDFHKKYPEAVIGLSEYGADANPAYQSGHPAKGDWSEGYQAIYHEHLLKMWQERPYIWAMLCWNGFDFGADGRDEGGKPGQNQKGLITFDRKIKKDAYYIYKAYLSDEPFVHICGRRYIDRAEETTEIRVYSNLPEVTLSVDGKEAESKKGDKVFVFNIPISGEHSITAIAKLTEADGDNATDKVCTDTISIRRVAEPNPDYIREGGEIINWFDRDDEIEREGYYSIKDSMGDIKKNADAKAAYDELIAPLQEKLIAKYGDVAKNIEMPPEMQAMQDRMSVEETLKQLGSLIDPETVHNLNHRLNQIAR